MRKITDENIRKHLIDLKAEDKTKADIMMKLREHVFAVFPKATEEIKYGGIIFLMDGNLFGGVFASKKHVSMEFSFGAVMSDPDKKLEGGGKYRRHLKIHNLEELKEKKITYYLKQAIQKTG